MPIVQTESWCLEIPEEWNASNEEGCVTIADNDELGEINLSVSFKEQGEVDEQDFSLFAEDLLERGLKPEPCTAGNTLGWCFTYEEGGESWREWYLACGQAFVFVTYACDLENAGLDDAMVDDILSTLSVMVPE